jgi:methyl-accepting chemotaxis protein
MFKSLNIKSRIIIPTALVIVVGLTIILGMFAGSYLDATGELSDNLLLTDAERQVGDAARVIESGITMTETLGDAIGAMAEYGKSSRSDIVSLLVREVTYGTNVSGAFAYWDPDAFDGEDNRTPASAYTDDSGRFVPYVYKFGDTLGHANMEDITQTEEYKKCIQSEGTIVGEPFQADIVGEKRYSFRVYEPIWIEDAVVGVMGMEFSLIGLVDTVQQAQVMKSSYAFLVTDQGQVVSHKNEDFQRQNLVDVASAEIVTSMEKAMLYGYAKKTTFEENGVSYEAAIAPIQIADTGSTWAVGVVALESEIKAAANAGLKTAILVSAIVGLIIIAMLYIFVRKIGKDLEDVSDSLSQATTQIGSASDQLANSSQQLSDSSNEQASSIEETSASMEETTTMIQLNAENTKETLDVALETQKVTKEGFELMQEVVKWTNHNNETSKKMAKIIKVIDDIAFQTNMLALNAAVEAARAGEAGAGFAVVAEEVRNLAHKSAIAAQDTEELLADRMHFADDDAQRNTSAMNTFEDVMQRLDKITDLVREISTASDEQSKGAQQVSYAMSNMETTVQVNAAAAEETAAAAEELEAQASELNKYMRQIDKIIHGLKQKVKQSSIEQQQNVSVIKAERSTKESRHKTSEIAVERKAVGQNEFLPEDIIPLEDDNSF